MFRSADRPARFRRVCSIWAVIVSLLALGAAYTAFQRFGTTANADLVEFTPNLAGGFLAIGMTEHQPGFVVLSALDQEKVIVTAQQSVNRLAGTHTVVRVTTPTASCRKRLRGPIAVIVSDDGSLTALPVDWSAGDFQSIRQVVDCAHGAGKKVHRCGAPFADLSDLMSRWPGPHVPEQVTTFLTAHQSANSRARPGPKTNVARGG